MSLFDAAGHWSLNFVHKRLLGAAKSFVTSGFDPRAAVGGFARGGSSVAVTMAPPVRRPPPRTLTARPSAMSAAEKEMGRSAKFPPGSVPMRTLGTARSSGLCAGILWVRTETGCKNVATGEERPFDNGGNGTMMAPVGDAVMGRYGAALVPGSKIIDRAVCLPGMHLGDDDLCYNKGQITNKQRAWPKGRKPLLTGGEMRAITVAATAGRRLERASKRLQKIGLMKKPARGVSRRQIAAEIHHAK